MKAVVWTRYGPPEVLQLQEVKVPIPKEGEVLIKVQAASINSWDLELLEGRAQITLGGRLPPKYRILGCDIAGTVESVGDKVKAFHPGDEVFADISRSGWGGFAEYVCVQQRYLQRKSAKMSFVQAAAFPQAGVMALQALRDRGRLKEGERALINGAGGGVGTFAVQIAKALGAEVTAVDREGKLAMLRSIGADHVVDHLQDDFTRSEAKYDLIIDVVSNRSVLDYRRALRPRGRCIVVGGTAAATMQALFLGPWALGGKKERLLLLRPDPNDLDHLNRLFDAGKVVPVIDRTFPLSETASAFRYYSEGNVKGKIVIEVG